MSAYDLATALAAVLLLSGVAYLGLYLHPRTRPGMARLHSAAAILGSLVGLGLALAVLVARGPRPRREEGPTSTPPPTLSRYSPGEALDLRDAADRAAEARAEAAGASADELRALEDRLRAEAGLPPLDPP